MPSVTFAVVAATHVPEKVMLPAELIQLTFDAMLDESAKVHSNTTVLAVIRLSAICMIVALVATETDCCTKYKISLSNSPRTNAVVAIRVLLFPAA